jgi:hypothetical protein
MNDKKPTPVPAHLINPLAGTYIPARDNPMHNVRPGADDHKLHKSLPAQGHATYHRGHV